jgi:hypothetical protein
MAYFTDGNGNYYCGKFSQQINYSYNTSDLTDVLLGTLRTDLTAILGLLNYVSYTFFDIWANGNNNIDSALVYQTPVDIASANRISFTYNLYSIARHQQNSPTFIFSEASYISGVIRHSNLSYIVSQYGTIVIQHNISDFTIPDYKIVVNTQLVDVNTTVPSNSSVPYYSGFLNNTFISLFQTTTTTKGEHFITQTNTARKLILLTNDAVYGIACNDGQTAGTDLWMTKLHVFDSTLRSNGVSSKYSRIGTIPNMAIGIGTSWIIGRIYSPITNLFPGNNNKWLCVGKWNNLSNRFVLVNVWSD